MMRKIAHTVISCIITLSIATSLQAQASENDIAKAISACWNVGAIEQPIRIDVQVEPGPNGLDKNSVTLVGEYMQEKGIVDENYNAARKAIYRCNIANDSKLITQKMILTFDPAKMIPRPGIPKPISQANKEIENLCLCIGCGVNERAYTVTSNHMLPNFQTGECIRGELANSNSVFERGEVLFVRRMSDEKLVFSRLIGLPGDIVQLWRKDVRVNGVSLEVRRSQVASIIADQSDLSLLEGEFHCVPQSGFKKKCSYRRSVQTLPNGLEFEFIDGNLFFSDLDKPLIFNVPENSYFLLGDYRRNSLDSRYPKHLGGLGMVKASDVVARAKGKIQIDKNMFKNKKLFKQLEVGMSVSEVKSKASWLDCSTMGLKVLCLENEELLMTDGQVRAVFQNDVLVSVQFLTEDLNMILNSLQYFSDADRFLPCIMTDENETVDLFLLRKDEPVRYYGELGEVLQNAINSGSFSISFLEVNNVKNINQNSCLEASASIDVIRNITIDFNNLTGVTALNFEASTAALHFMSDRLSEGFEKDF